MSTATEVGPTQSVTGALARVTAAVIVGDNPAGTALAAIAAARAASRNRIVTIVDLIGDVPPLRALAEDDDPHGVSDCFVYGISPKSVTRRTHADERLFVIGGGTEPIDHAHVLPSPRWGKLIAEYERAGALVVFVAVARTPGLADLITQTEGVVTVGTAGSLLPPDTRVLANATPPRVSPVPRRAVDIGMPRTRRRRAIATVLASAAVIAIAAWLIATPSGRPRDVASAAAARADTVTAAASAQLGSPPPAADSTAATPPAAAAAPPAAAAPAARYAVHVATVPTYTEALRLLRGGTRRAATITPVGKEFFVLDGAYTDSAAAQRSVKGPESVMLVPLALRLADSISVDSARALARRYLARGIPAYMLTTAAGGAVYVGAFTTSDDAGPLTASLRRIGLSPVLAARTGRP